MGTCRWIGPSPHVTLYGVVSLSRRRILIVDDQVLVARALQRQLRQASFDVSIAATKEEALASIASQPPHVVVCDFELGADTSSRLLETLAREHPSIRRVLFSASRPELWRHLVERDLVHATLMKPCSPQELIAAITG